MSIAIGRPTPSRPDARGVGSPLHSVLFLSIIGLVLSLAMSWPSAVAVWRTGAFANTDDAMRLVEVRDWLAGQGWFDLRQYRLDPPDGVQMHWTRVVDLPLGLLVRGFSIASPIEDAERLTRIVFPITLHLALFATVASAARKLAGPASMLPAVMIVALTGDVLAQFQPGRIHHHSAQILLVVLILRVTLSAIESKTFWPAAGAAALASLSLSINIENLPYVLVEIGVFAVAFVAQGERFRGALLGFALSLALSSLLVFVATVGPSRYFVGACDAFSTAHLLAIFVGAAVLSVLAALSAHLHSALWRLAGCALGGVLVLSAVALVYPACLHDPQAGVDPLLRKLWLENVVEARPLASIVVGDPRKFVTLALPLLLGFAASLVAAWREKGAARVGWMVAIPFVAIGLVTAMWQVRALSSASALAVFGGAWLIAQAIDWAAKRASALMMLVPFALGLPFCSVFWAIVTPAAAQPNAAVDRGNCRAPAALDALRALPTSVLMAPIDMGSEILAETRHSVLAGPYHRNNHGNRQMVDAMIAEPAAAHDIVTASGAAYVVFCPAMPDVALYAAASPRGLAAVLLRNEAPDWLSREPIEGQPYRVYKVH